MTLPLLITLIITQVVISLCQRIARRRAQRAAWRRTPIMLGAHPAQAQYLLTLYCATEPEWQQQVKARVMRRR